MSNDEYSFSNYWKAVQSYAEEIIEQAKEEGIDFDEISDLIHETADQSRWVFMYYGAMRTIEHSSNSDAYADTGIELDGSSGFNNICVQVAYWALYTDIQDALKELEDEMVN